MTRFSLNRLRLRPGEEHRDQVLVELQPFDLGGQRYLPVPPQAPSELTVTRATSGDVLRLRFATRLHGPCMRCLGDAVLVLSVDVREYHDSDARAPEELHSEYVSEGMVDLTRWARDALAEHLPDQILCRPDCAGLCPVCGKDLNAEPHDHPETVGDPRWAALEELRDRL
jgi:DUF177 domain-containing protein